MARGEIYEKKEPKDAMGPVSFTLKGSYTSQALAILYYQMVKKKAASSGSKPTSAPSNTPQAPSDEQPKKSMARELLQKAFDGLSAFRNLTSRLVLSTEEKVVVENIEMFILTQKLAADKASTGDDLLNLESYLTLLTIE
ncbi:hypothetical protein PLEOSDRAFT_1109779 [Pleurotus ostreatus PC15]|uniref:Uncharacterized protein n=1 Tax=Pleurotus ostreatus (strain PC15) TaxID=1137138 RepID=A0A067N4Q4_PLEO1|nr:hypothetical protein PLEOSDRAFT_1109779 [Pleurotus ostreatus PC15]